MERPVQPADHPVTPLRCVLGFHLPFQKFIHKEPTMAQRDDDDFIDPFKFLIGCFNVFFGIIKWIVEHLLRR